MDRRIIKRSTAERMLRDVISRAKRINANRAPYNGFDYTITSLVVFGSFVASDRDKIGDLDIGFEMQLRPQVLLLKQNDDRYWMRLAQHRAEQDYRTLRSFLEALTYPRIRTIRALKAR